VHSLDREFDGRRRGEAQADWTPATCGSYVPGRPGVVADPQQGRGKRNGKIVVLTGRAVSDELKRTCESNDLPLAYFSAQSVRQRAITHMHAQCTTEEDRWDRGNYSAGSQVMNMTYGYASGLGPLGSSSLEGGHKQKKSDLKRLLPLSESTKEV
jgi:hypothetical protein